MQTAWRPFCFWQRIASQDAAPQNPAIDSAKRDETVLCEGMTIQSVRAGVFFDVHFRPDCRR